MERSGTVGKQLNDYTSKQAPTESLNQWRTGGLRVFKPPPPGRNSEGPPKNRAKLNPIVKTVKKKMLNLGRQHTKMFGKKGS